MAIHAKKSGLMIAGRVIKETDSFWIFKAIDEKNPKRIKKSGAKSRVFDGENAVESICAVLEMVAQDYKREDEAKLIYEAIAAGKIPGVKLDD